MVAREDSGVFSTVNWAVEQGKGVFAVPGPITSQVSKGPNRPIKQEVSLVESVEEILEALKIVPSENGRVRGVRRCPGWTSQSLRKGL